MDATVGLTSAAAVGARALGHVFVLWDRAFGTETREKI